MRSYTVVYLCGSGLPPGTALAFAIGLVVSVDLPVAQLYTPTTAELGIRVATLALIA
jgi:hypothetical protein